MERTHVRSDGTLGDPALDELEAKALNSSLNTPHKEKPSSKLSFRNIVGNSIWSVVAGTTVVFGIVSGSLPQEERELLMSQMRQGIQNLQSDAVDVSNPSSGLAPRSTFTRPTPRP